MAGAIKGITVEIGANTTKLTKALRSASAPVNKLKNELKSVEALLKMNPGNADLLRQKETLLAQSVEKVEGNLKKMKTALEAAKAGGTTEKNSAGFRKLQQEIIKTETELRRLRAESASMSIIGSGIGQAAAKMAALGEKATALGQKLRGVSVAAGLIGTMAVATVSEFDSAMSKVQAVSGATGEGFTKLRDKAREMGEKTKFSATESAEAMNYMAMAGWKTEDMLSGIEGIMYLAAASGEDLATTSDIVTDALTAMGYAASDSGRLADVMAAASSNANTNVSMMGETFRYAAAVAGSMGYSMEDVALATGLMANAGIKATQAGTSLRSIISRMAAPTAAVSSEMKKLGVSITDSNGNARPFRDVLTDLREAMSGMSETEKTAAASTIAGKNAMSGFLALINASDKDFNKLTSAIDNSSGAAENMAGTMNDNFGGQITILKSALQELAISMGDTLVPTLRSMVSAVQAVVGWFNGLSGGTKTMITKMVVLAGILSPVLLTFGAITKAINSSVVAFVSLFGKVAAVSKEMAVFSGVQKAASVTSGFLKGAVNALRGAHAAEAARIATCTSLYGANTAAIYGNAAADRAAAAGMKAAQTAQSALNAVLSLGPWKLVAIGIGVAAAAMGVFLATNDEARGKVADTFSEISEKAVTAFKNLPSVLSETGSQMKSVLPGLFTTLQEVFPDIVSAMTSAAPEIMAAGLNMFQSLTAGLADVMPQITAGISSAVSAIVNTLSTTLPQMVEKGAELIVSLVTGLSAALPGLIETGTRAVISLISGITAALPGLISSAATVITTLITAFTENITPVMSAGIEIIGLLINGVLSALPTIINSAVTIITTLITGLISALPEIITAAIAIVAALINGLSQAIPQILAAAVEIIAALAKGLIQAIPKLIAALPQIILAIVTGLVTLSVSLIAAGKKIITAVAKGIKSSGSKVAAAAWNAVKGIPKKVLAIAGSMLSAGVRIIRSLISGIKSMISGITGAVSSIANKIKNKFKSINLLSIGKSIMSGLARGIRNGLSACISAASSVARSIISKFKSLLKINSPSKVMRDTIGISIPEGIAKGMLKGKGLVTKAAGRLSEEALISQKADAVSSFSERKNSGSVVRESIYGGATYSFGNITLDVSELKNVTTIEDIADIFRRAKAFS